MRPADCCLRALPRCVKGCGPVQCAGDGTTCGASLAAKKNCIIAVSFSPKAVGARTGTVLISDNAAGSPQNVGLTGTGVLPVTISPSSLSLSFGSVLEGGTSVAKNVTVTNNQTVPNSLSASGIGGTPFAIAGAGTACGSTLAANSSCKFAVTFSPPAGTKGSAFNATLKITDSPDYQTNSPHSVGLSGSAT